MYREIFLDRHLPTSLMRNVLNHCVLPAMTYVCQTWSLTKALIKKLEKKNPTSHGKENANVKLKDRFPNAASIRQRTRVRDIFQYVTNAKWKWAGHSTRMKDNKQTIRNTAGMSDKGCKISWKTKSSLERWHCGATGSGMGKDTKQQRKLEDSVGGLFPAVEGHSLD